MPLIGPDAQAIFTENIPFLIIGGDDRFECVTINGFAVGPALVKERMNIYPALCIGLYPDDLRPVPEHHTEEFTELDEMAFVCFHGFSFYKKNDAKKVPEEGRTT
jgi:hypothetical protein